MKETLSQASAKARRESGLEDAIEAARAYKGDSCNNYPHIYGGNAYGELRRQTILERIRGIFRR
jgi:hypothetical protein